MTCPDLFAIANGISPRSGPHHCWYCGAACDESNPTSEFVKDSFTGRDAVIAPGSLAVCDGCVACLNERMDLVTHDGQHRERQKVRCYSWVLTQVKATAATKADRQFLRDTCEHPPAPPFSVVISDSGQKHLLYRGIVCHSQAACVVTLEGVRVVYAPYQLTERIALAVRLIATIGKPPLSDDLSRTQRMMICDKHGEETLKLWLAIRESPLTRLAIWLAPGKEGAEIECGIGKAGH